MSSPPKRWEPKSKVWQGRILLMLVVADLQLCPCCLSMSLSQSCHKDTSHPASTFLFFLYLTPSASEYNISKYWHILGHKSTEDLNTSDQWMREFCGCISHGVDEIKIPVCKTQLNKTRSRTVLLTKHVSIYSVRNQVGNTCYSQRNLLCRSIITTECLLICNNLLLWNLLNCYTWK